MANRRKTGLKLSESGKKGFDMAGLTLKSLGSSLIKEMSTGGGFIRKLSPPSLALNKDKEDGNFWGWLGGLIKWGWDGLSLSFSWLWSQVVSPLWNFVVNFNFNASDEELDKAWSNFLSTLAGQIGGTLGNFAGWLTCGAVPGLALMKFNKSLGLRVLQEVGEEALDELAANVRLVCTTAIRGLLAAGVTNLYKCARTALRSVNTEVGAAFANALYGDGGAAKLKEKQSKPLKPWTIRKAWENYWEKDMEDDSAPVQNFKEEFLEEFGEACGEAFYVVAGTADQWMLEQRLNRPGINGPDEVLEIYPDRENEEEKIVLAGPQELLKPVIVNTITQYQMIEDRSIGNFMGETIETVANRAVRTLMARLIFSSSEKKKKDVTSVTLYNVDKSKLDWLELKQAMGGQNGYMWGPWRVDAAMDDATVIKIWAASEEEGVDRLTALSKFVEGEILTINSYHELKEGKRKVYDSLYKKARKQYPWELLIINPIQILNEENGKATKKGVYKDREALIPLWPKDKPDDWAQKLADLFATPGPDDL